MTVLVVALAALLPCIPLKIISNEGLARARNLWLLAFLVVATVWAIQGAPPFAPIGLYFLVWWRGRRFLGPLVIWVGLAGFWWALRLLTPQEWALLPWGWLLVGTVATGQIAREWWALRPPDRWWDVYRPLHQAAWFGQRTLAAAFFALLLPFCPWWAAPIPVLGLALTSSWGAWLAGLVGLAVLQPIVALGAILALTAGGLWAGVYTYLQAPAFYRAAGWRKLVKDALEHTPRGSSFDSLWQRWRVLGMMLRVMVSPRRPPLLRDLYTEMGPNQYNGPWWQRGFGPRTFEPTIIRWGTVYSVDRIPLGHSHVDILQFLWEYGPFGIATCLIVLLRVAPNLHFGDPWSAAWAAGVILGMVTLPFRVAGVGLVWLAITAKLMV